MMSLTSFVTLAALMAAAAAQQLMVNTPTSVVHCLPVQLTWSGGQGPYYVSLLPGGQPSATPIADLGEQSGNSYSWIASIPAGTQVTVQIRDHTGALNYSDQFTIQPGSGTGTCKDDSGSSSTTTATTSSPPAASTGAATTNSTASKTPTTANTTTTSTTKSTTSSSPATSTGTTTPSGGSTSTPVNGSTGATDARNGASRTSAGVMAVAVAAVVAVFA